LSPSRSAATYRSFQSFELSNWEVDIAMILSFCNELSREPRRNLSLHSRDAWNNTGDSVEIRILQSFSADTFA
jgi:hypothetical protein